MIQNFTLNEFTFNAKSFNERVLNGVHVSLVTHLSADFSEKISKLFDGETRFCIGLPAYYFQAECLSHDTTYFPMSARTFENMV